MSYFRLYIFPFILFVSSFKIFYHWNKVNNFWVVQKAIFGSKDFGVRWKRQAVTLLKYRQNQQKTWVFHPHSLSRWKFYYFFPSLLLKLNYVIKQLSLRPWIFSSLTAFFLDLIFFWQVMNQIKLIKLYRK